MVSEGSVTDWIRELKAGDEPAAQKLWERYFSRLVRLCRKKLGGHPRRADDEEDIALSAFDSLCRGAREGRFPLLRDRDNLWPLLVVIASRKAVDQIRRDHREKRGGGQVQGESALDGDQSYGGQRGIEQVIGNEPTPGFAALVAEQYERLLKRLGDQTLQTVAQLKLQGYTSEEIAQRLDCSKRTVTRKLWRIRTIWCREGPDDE